MRVRFGVCAPIEKLSVVVDAGYDYIELNFSGVVAMTEEDFQKTKETLDKYNVKAESFNCFFPGGIRLTGTDVDYDKIKTHIERGMARVAQLGAAVTVIGSGAARNIPEGFDFSEGYNQFVKVVRIAGEIAAKYGITVVVEPLCAAESNLINTVAQGIELAKIVNLPNVKGLADFHHVYKSGETLDAIKNSDGWLGHLHIARANDDRSMPYEEDIPQVEEWAAAVKTSGYEGRLSLEGSYLPEFTECICRTRKIIECFNK